jgi:hypothetical protein
MKIVRHPPHPKVFSRMRGRISPQVAEMLGTVDGRTKLQNAIINSKLIDASKVNLKSKRRWFDSFWFITLFSVFLVVFWAAVMIALFFLLLYL